MNLQSNFLTGVPLKTVDMLTRSTAEAHLAAPRSPRRAADVACAPARIAAPSREQGVESAVLSLPKHLWGWLTQYLDVAGICATLQGSRLLWEALDDEVLWLHQCVADGLTRSVHGADWTFPAEPEGDGCQIKWQRLLRENARPRCRTPVWIRIRDTDLHFPVSLGESCGALLERLGRVVLPGSDGAEAPSRLSLRLRRMQRGGQPGMALHEGLPMRGGHFLLEWSARKEWPLPPAHEPSTQITQSKSFLEWIRRHDDAPTMAWRHLEKGAAAHPMKPITLQEEEPETSLMVRVLTQHRPQESWLCMPLSSTWGMLRRRIAKLLRHEGFLPAGNSGLIKYTLMYSEKPWTKSPARGSTPLRELYWAQCETLRVELEEPPASPGRADAEAGGDGAGPGLSVLIWREEAFAQAPAHSLGSGSAEAEGCFGPTAALSRQKSEPVTAQSPGWSRQTSTPVPTQSSGWPRQLSEPVRLDAPDTPRLAQASRGRHHSDGLGALISDAGRAAAGASMWGRIVPHYEPQVLPRTLDALHFEFHPTLPEVVLTGGMDGTVNALNLQTGLGHPPCSVGPSPISALVWLRRHEQRAVCGAWDSGEVTLLQYRPQARSWEPALWQLQAVDPFPNQLSSLSANSTDDFLVASGMSPYVRVYDLQTGQVLHRARAHENVISASQFCHTSPHIFATASFDQTCKIWDLRQPFLYDVPVRTLPTGGRNAMCAFSPNDDYLLCSGADSQIVQYEVASWRRTPERLPMPRRASMQQEGRHRSSAYLATGRHFVSSVAGESRMHLMTATGEPLGAVDFRGVLQGEAWRKLAGCPWAPPNQGFGAAPSLMQTASGFSPPPRGGRVGGVDRSGPEVAGRPQREGLVQGALQPDEGFDHSDRESILAVRPHPLVQNRVGVLLSSEAMAEQSAFVLVDVDSGTLQS